MEPGCNNAYNNGVLSYMVWGTGGSWTTDGNAFVTADFDRNGYSDIAYIYADGNGLINIDVYLAGLGDADMYGFDTEGFVAERWATHQGSWIANMNFLAGDFNGDGYPDIAATFDNGNGTFDYDVHVNAEGSSFSGIQRWNNQQGGIIGAGSASDMIDRSHWFAGYFDGDDYEDLAYAYADPGTGDIDIDVHRSLGSQAAGGFQEQRWATNEGGWVGLGTTDPAAGLFGQDDADSDYCWACDRQAQWAAGDFNNDGLTDLALAYNGGGGLNIDIHFSLGSQAAGGFNIQRAATGQGGWLEASVLVAADMDADGRDDLVYTYSVGRGFGINEDVHSSTVPYGATTIPSGTGFANASWLNTVDDSLYDEYSQQANFAPAPKPFVGGALGGYFYYPHAPGEPASIVFFEPSYNSDNSPNQITFNAAAKCGSLQPGEMLYQWQSLFSCDGQYFLTMQSDGNFVLYQKNTMAVIWMSSTAASQHPPGYVIPTHAVMQTDGNLVLLDGNDNFIWGGYQSTPGYKLVDNSYLAIQNAAAFPSNNAIIDGAGLVLYPPNNGRERAYTYEAMVNGILQYYPLQYNWACESWTCEGANY